LLAIDAATGDIAWQVALGITEQLPEDRHKTGRPNAGGPIATAGGLVLIGASNDRRFRAFDSRSGEELWAVALDASAHAVPITYLGAGKQYVAIVAGGSDGGAEAQALIVYALP
jgi:quinoprotein glucose dehydrogenase